MRIVTLNAIFVVLSLTPSAWAQSGANVTLQLPSFHLTGVNTTVLVPDRGASPLATQRQSFYGRSMYGPRRPSPLDAQALGSSQAAGGMQVTAQVHDPRAAEAEMLRTARERRATWQRVPRQLGSLDGRNLTGKTISGEPLLSVAEIRRRKTTAAANSDAARNVETTRLLAEARRARAQGKSGAAAVYYQMAARRASGAERAAITTEAAQAD